MMRIVRAKDIDASRLVGCDLVKNQDIEAQVAAILEDVRARGDAALLDYTERFDGVRPETLEVAQSDMDAACRSVGEDFLRTLEMAAANIRAFHSRQVRGDFMVNEQPGVVLGQKVLPLRRVGLYVPGGTAAYPSTVLMDAIPAKIAGVREVVMATPPGRDGRVPEAVLAAARVAGVTRVLRMGGAQAVAALAFGTQSIPRVDKNRRSRQYLRRHGQTAGIRAGGYRYGGRAQRDSRHRRPNGQPRPCGGGFAVPGRARPVGQRHSGHAEPCAGGSRAGRGRTPAGAPAACVRRRDAARRRDASGRGDRKSVV